MQSFSQFKRLSFALLLGLISVVAVAAPKTTLNVVDATKPIRITTKQPQFSVRLEANPSTGYSWIIKSYDKDLVRVVGVEHDQFSATRIGKGGADTWTFEVLPKAFTASHATTVVLMYARPWEMVPAKFSKLMIVTEAKN